MHSQQLTIVAILVAALAWSYTYQSQYYYNNNKPQFAVPVIDIAPLTFPEYYSQTAKSQAIRDIHAAMKSIGFMVIKNHGIPQDLLENVYKSGKHFFSLDHDVKMTLASNSYNKNNKNWYRGYFPASVFGKEGFDYGFPNVTDQDFQNSDMLEKTPLPSKDDVGDEWHDIIDEYYVRGIKLGVTLLNAIASGINAVPNPPISTHFTAPLATLRFNNYPNMNSSAPPATMDGDVPLSCETHVDGSLLTLLFGDIPGLQVQALDDKWYNIPLIPGTIVVNTGLGTQRLSNNQLNATNHRVLFSRKERMTIPFFIEPNYDMEIGPWPGTVTDDLPKAYEPMDYKAYITWSNMRFLEYADRDK